jgi:soluble lytic murein transglycosylase-like protein
MALAFLALATTACAPASFHPDLDKELLRLASLEVRDLPSVLQNLDRDDSIGAYYRDPMTRAATEDFFAALTHSPTVASAILDNAERYGVPPALAFALAYEESKFAVDAMNKNGDSVDRGLFQLNSNSFPNLSRASFYDPRVSAKYGLSHLQFLLRQAGNEVSALAMYNAGNGSVTRGRTPQKTLDYVFRILKYEENRPR